MDVLTGRSVVCEVRVKAAPETIFPFLIDGERSARWFGRSASIDPRPGGMYRTEISDQIVAAGEIVEIDEPRRLVLSFGWEGNEGVPPGSSRVEITLEPDGEETVAIGGDAGLDPLGRAAPPTGEAPAG